MLSHWFILTLMTPGKSTSTILWMPGPLTLNDIVWHVKNKHDYSMIHYRSKSLSSSFVIYLNGNTMSNLRADCLSFLHTLPHPQLDLVPQSSKLQDRGRKTRYTVITGNQVKALIHIRSVEWKTLWLTSSSLVRSNSRPLSLNKATWWGPSLSVTYRKKMSIVKSFNVVPKK